MTVLVSCSYLRISTFSNNGLADLALLESFCRNRVPSCVSLFLSKTHIHEDHHPRSHTVPWVVVTALGRHSWRLRKGTVVLTLTLKGTSVGSLVKTAVWPPSKGIAWQITWSLPQQSYRNLQFLFIYFFSNIFENFVTLKNEEARP